MDTHAMGVKTNRPYLWLQWQGEVDHCFYIAKCPDEPAGANHQPGGFWVLLAVQKYRGKHSVTTFKSLGVERNTRTYPHKST